MSRFRRRSARRWLLILTVLVGTACGLGTASGIMPAMYALARLRSYCGVDDAGRERSLGGVPYDLADDLRRLEDASFSGSLYAFGTWAALVVAAFIAERTLRDHGDEPSTRSQGECPPMRPSRKS